MYGSNVSESLKFRGRRWQSCQERCESGNLQFNVLPTVISRSMEESVVKSLLIATDELKAVFLSKGLDLMLCS